MDPLLKKEAEVNTADFRSRRADILSRVAERVGGRQEQDISTPEGRLAALLGDSDIDFIDSIVAVNRVLVKNHQDTEHTGFLATQQNIIGRSDDPTYMHLLPMLEDKEPLLAYLRGTMLDMRERGRSVGYVAAVMGMGINAIHPFNFGNGRTARAIHGLVTLSPDKWEDMLRARTSDTVKNTDSLTPEVFEEHVYAGIRNELDTHVMVNGAERPRRIFAVSQRTLEIMMKAIDSDDERKHLYADIISAVHVQQVSSIVAAIADKLDTKTPLIDACVQSHQGQEIFNLDAFYRCAKNEDWLALREAARYVHVKYVVNLLDMLSSPVADIHEVSVETNEHGAMRIPLSRYVTLMAKQAITRVL